MTIKTLIPKGREVAEKLFWLYKAKKLSAGRDYSTALARIPDEIWFWFFTGGYRRFPVLRSLLPGMPDEQTQINYVGSSGYVALRQAFLGYSLFRKKTIAYHGPLGPQSHVLDFGCGWGRITRFFLRDVPGTNVQGVDVSPTVIELCKQTYRDQVAFSVIPAFPPIDFPDDKFDLIYLYSVFSHLSEKAVDNWVSEFHRILKPGGMLIATTRSREFFEQCENFRNGKSPGYEAMREAFVGPSGWQARYDRGEFCFEGTGGGENRSSDFYGEACIPSGYVEAKWSDRFHVREFINYKSASLDQNVIVAQKK